MLTTRVLLKVFFVLVLSAVVAVGGQRMVLGHWPSVIAGVLATAILFVAVVVLDVAVGW
ncbi:MAG TPA: hypothetical protein VMP03_06460 [Methylomirabilota bacterium]|nr:hypothetical protein [Methylomirabilota bacterium]